MSDDEDRLLIDDADDHAEMKESALDDQRVDLEAPAPLAPQLTVSLPNAFPLNMLNPAQLENRPLQEGAELENKKNDVAAEQEVMSRENSASSPSFTTIDSGVVQPIIACDNKPVTATEPVVNSKPEKRPSSTPVDSKHSKRSKTAAGHADKETCVRSLSLQTDMDESPFDLEPGSSFTIQCVVGSRMENPNLIYYTAKIKDQEVFGILSDGEPPGLAAFMKKRSTTNNGTSMSNSSSENGDRTPVSGTPSKKRSGRTYNSEPRRRPNRNENDDDDELDVTGNGEKQSPSSGTTTNSKLVEVSKISSLQKCPEEGCSCSFYSLSDLHFHVHSRHKKRAVMKVELCSQTDLSSFQIGNGQCSVGVDTEDLNKTEPVVVKEEENRIQREEDIYSDISDDLAPQLQKEEPQTTEKVPVDPVCSTVPTSSVTPKAIPAVEARAIPVVPNPVAALPTAFSIPRPTAAAAAEVATIPPSAATPAAASTPARVPNPNGILPNDSFAKLLSPYPLQPGVSASPAREHKINQLKPNGSESAVVSATPTKPSATATMAQSPFSQINPLLNPPGSSIPASIANNSSQIMMMMAHQHQMQNQALMQLMQGGRTPFQIPPNPSDPMSAAMLAAFHGYQVPK